MKVSVLRFKALSVAAVAVVLAAGAACTASAQDRQTTEEKKRRKMQELNEGVARYERRLENCAGRKTGRCAEAGSTPDSPRSEQPEKNQGKSGYSAEPAQTEKPAQTERPAVNTAAAQGNGWDIAALNTARNAAYLSDLEKEVILELNMARSNPARYAELYINPNQGAYARECYAEMKRAGGLPALLPKKGLSQAAKDHVADTGPKGIIGHKGANGSSMTDRINRYGTWGAGASENISYGATTARGIVVQLLIDDGVESRGHRKNILNGGSRFVGVAAGAHAGYRFMCVQNFAGDYTDR